METLELSPEQIEAANVMIADAFKNRAGAAIDDGYNERDLSRAQRRMQARKRARPDTVQTYIVTIDGQEEEWFASALSAEDLNAIGILRSADGFSAGDPIATPDSWRSFDIALLSVGLVVSVTDEEKFFESVAEATEFYDDARNADIAMLLRGAILEMNPYLVATSAAAKKKAPTIRKSPTQSTK